MVAWRFVVIAEPDQPADYSPQDCTLEVIECVSLQLFHPRRLSLWPKKAFESSPCMYACKVTKHGFTTNIIFNNF